MARPSEAKPFDTMREALRGMRDRYRGGCEFNLKQLFAEKRESMREFEVGCTQGQQLISELHEKEKQIDTALQYLDVLEPQCEEGGLRIVLAAQAGKGPLAFKK